MSERLSDRELLGRLKELAADTRRTTADLIALLIEVEDRGLHLSESYSSLFAFCQQVLKLSEGETANRIAAARAARRYPMILELLRAGEVNLTTVRLLSPHLTAGNHEATLRAACGLTRPQVEALVVSLAPKPLPVPSLRKLPTPVVSPVMPRPLSAIPKPAVMPLAPEVFRLTVTMDVGTREQWQRLKELLGGDDAQVLARLVALATPLVEKRKLADTGRAAPPTSEGSRHIPAAVRREVGRRDGQQCAFEGANGRRCAERRFLQCHHVRPWAAGGPTTVDNLELRCRAHNQHEADSYFLPLRQHVPEHAAARGH